jgi:predicted amidohydrolase
MPQQIVAAVQFEPKLHAVRENLGVALQLSFEAAAKGARVVVLPELCLSGFSLQNPNEAIVSAQTRSGYQTEAFLPICQRFNCHIVFGYVELQEGKLYNSAAIVGPLGLEGNAQKHNLVGADNLWAQPSEASPPCVITGAGRLGVLVCRDATNNYRESYVFHNPKHRFYRKGDVDTLALVTNWGSGHFFPDAAWVELVESTRSNLIVSNRVGREKDLKFKGGSCVVDRNRRIWTFGSNFDSSAVVGGIVLV